MSPNGANPTFLAFNCQPINPDAPGGTLAEGVEVGVAVRLAVGVGVGVGVRLAVGEGVGVAVRLAVGEGVGVAVRLAVGVGIGVAVGDTEDVVPLVEITASTQ